MLQSTIFKLDEHGERIVRIPGVPTPKSAAEDTAEQLEKMSVLAKYVEVSFAIVLNCDYDPILNYIIG